jgi:hypothetical protein
LQAKDIGIQVLHVLNKGFSRDGANAVDVEGNYSHFILL